MANEDTIFGSYPAAAWQVASRDKLFFPIVGQLQEKGGKRLVRHPRPYRKGAKLDSTGVKEREWTFTIEFNNTFREQDIDNPAPLYPDVLNSLIQSFDDDETGTLTLPTIGDVRARADSYTRIEDTNERDQATLQVTFVEDNEESAAAITFLQPSVRSSIGNSADATVFSADAVGATDGDLAQAKQKSITIAQLLAAPGRAVSDLQAISLDAQRALARVRSNQESFARAVGLAHDEPRGSEFWRNLIRLQDLEAKSSDEKFSSRPRITTFIVDVDRTNLFAIAARFKQDAGELLDLNSDRLPDPFALEKGDVIRVYERPPA